MFVKKLKRILFIGGFVLIDLLLDPFLKGIPQILKTIAGIVFLIIAFFLGRRILSEYQTAGIIFSILAVVVAYSTFLHRTDLYFTFWFNVLFGLLLISILSCVFVLKPKFDLRYISFLTLHISIIVVAAGFLINAYGMKKCYFPLLKGKTMKECLVMGNTEVTEKKTGFPYPVTLIDFKVAYYESEPVIGVFLRTGKKYKLIKTFPLEKNKSIFGLRFKGLDTRKVQLPVIWGEGREGSFPLGKVFLEQNSAWTFSTGEQFPGLVGISSEKTREFYVPIKDQPIVVGRSFVVIPMEFYPNFKYDILGKKAFSEGNDLKNPALKLRILTPGGEKQTYIFASSGKPIHLGGYLISYTMDTGGLSFIAPNKTFTRNEVFTSIKGIFDIDGEEVMLLPEGEPYFKGKFAYRLLLVPPQEKEYTSLLRVEDTTFKVRVNRPFKYKGYVFYQNNYNPSNPDFSGIMVVKEPGENVLYSGFILMALGALLTVAYRRKIWN